MKYSYSVEALQLKNSKHFTFALTKELEPVTRFLNSDVGEEYGANIYLKAIKSVQSGEIEEKTISGNSTIIRIKADVTIVTDMFIEQKSVSIETSELELLIDAFIKEKKKFYEALSCEK